MRDTSQGYSQPSSVKQGYALTESDTDSLKHTWFRKLDSKQGRFTSPDPYAGSMSISNPQSFNRYAYVENDPVNFVDPSGLNMSPGGGSCWVTWSAIGQYVGDRLVGITDFRITGVSCSGGGGGYSGGGGFLGGGGQDIGPDSNKPANPSCNTFVNELVASVYDSLSRLTLGTSMMAKAVANPYQKAMPGDTVGGLRDANGFRTELTERNQRGDVYRHVLMVAGATITRDIGSIRTPFINKDIEQRNGGRSESVAEVADDMAGIAVGNLMDRALNKEIDRNTLQQGIFDALCTR